MAQIDANATLEQVAQMEREYARKRILAERKRAAELARLSDVRTVIDERGTKWDYLVVDGEFARVTKCSTEEESLFVPDTIDGLPVREIGTEALAGLPSVREIMCADSIESIGAYAFRICENLHKLVLPAKTNDFSAGWISKCPSLVELVLPDELKALSSEIVANPALRMLVIGRGAQFVEPGAFEKSQLQSIIVDPSNEYLKTDGTCLYTSDGFTLVALARPVQCCSVAAGCRHIGKKAFSGFTDLEQVKLPDGIESIDDLAFARSGVAAIDCPASLATIGAKAFLGCKSLEVATVREGLRSIGERAFANTALQGLHVPASVDSLGSAICEKSKARFSGDDATFTLDAGSSVYSLDGQGCLYRNEPDGVHLVEMLDPNTQEYEVRSDAVALDDRAFAFHNAIERVTLPEGLLRIGASAFKVCRRLRHVSIPDTLRSIGADAFLDTSIEHFRIPLALVEIGNCALVTDGAHHEGPKPALRTIDLAPDHSRFFMHTGMLCRRKKHAASVVVFTSSCENVDFPDEIDEVEDYAFNNAFGIRELRLNARLQTIGACGLSVMSQIRCVRIDVAKPIEGISSFTLRFPSSSRSVHGFLLALGGMGHLHMPDIMAQYDKFIAAARDYRAPRSSDNASAYEQVNLIIDRLNSPVLLTETNRRRYLSLLSENIEDICVEIARHDDRVALLQLADLGVLNADNLLRVVDAVGKLQDAAMTGYLLEMKRVRFAQRAVDFDL